MSLSHTHQRPYRPHRLRRAAGACRAVLRAVCSEMDLSPDDVTGKRRMQAIVRARRVCMVICVRLGVGVEEVGRRFVRDHATVFHHLRYVWREPGGWTAKLVDQLGPPLAIELGREFLSWDDIDRGRMRKAETARMIATKDRINAALAGQPATVYELGRRLFPKGTSWRTGRRGGLALCLATLGKMLRVGGYEVVVNGPGAHEKIVMPEDHHDPASGNHSEGVS